MPEQSENNRPPNKQRVSLTLEPEAIKMGEALADEENRSLSNLVEVLVEREYHRVFKTAKEVPAAA